MIVIVLHLVDANIPSTRRCLLNLTNHKDASRQLDIVVINVGTTNVKHYITKKGLLDLILPQHHVSLSTPRMHMHLIQR